MTDLRASMRRAGLITALAVTVLPAQTPAGAAAAAATVDAPVPPGLVRWHADLAAAQDAAGRQRRPVLLFQLLGDLDREFC
jgi:hypothetical protein